MQRVQMFRWLERRVMARDSFSKRSLEFFSFEILIATDRSRGACPWREISVPCRPWPSSEVDLVGACRDPAA